MFRISRIVKTDSNEFQDLLAAFDSTLRNGVSSRKAEYEGLLEGFSDAFRNARHNRAATTPYLNVLSVFGLKSRELCHSRVVAWFLDPNETHEQGALFLKTFLRVLGLPSSGSDQAIVLLERPNRVDVSVFVPGSFAFCIENKVYHEESEGQFAKLIRTLKKEADSRNIPREAQAAVFLTNSGKDPESSESEPLEGIKRKPISRLAVFEIFEDVLKTVPKKSVLLSSFLSAYINAIRDLE